MITPLPAGSTFAGYQVDAVLARGGMGVVYLATELRPRRAVALKLIAPALAADAAYRARFLREVDALAALEHPNVVPIHAAGEWDGQLYLAMRYLDGPDLAEVVRTRGPLQPAEAIALLAPIADALDVAHARGIVHRDVTPSNIRLDGRGVPYLTDFGLTKRAASAAAPGLTLGPMGTPAYMAPEQFASPSTDGTAAVPDPALASRADVYALGCVLVTLLTGAPPYPRDSSEAALWAHVHAEPPSLAARRPGLPPAIDAVVARALAKDPAARFASPGALIAAARAALLRPGPVAPVTGASPTETTIAVPPARGGEPRPGPTTARRRRAPALLALAAFVVVATVAGAVAVGSGLLRGGSGSPRLGGTGDPSGAAAMPSPTPVPTPVPTPSPSPTPSPTPRLGQPEEVARLRAWVPHALRDDCTTTPLRSPDEVAALRCPTKDEALVRYVLYASAERMDIRWGWFVEQAQITPGGRCADGEEASGTWGDHGLLGFFGEARGSLACTVEADGDARIDWTTVDAPIWATLWRADGDIAAAYATWLQGRLNPLRSPR